MSVATRELTLTVPSIVNLTDLLHVYMHYGSQYVAAILLLENGDSPHTCRVMKILAICTVRIIKMFECRSKGREKFSAKLEPNTCGLSIKH